MHKLILSLLACCCAALAAAEGDVYRAVMAELTRHPNRLPGSPGYVAALDAIEAQLKGAGLKTDRLTFGSAVPRSEELALTVDGRPVPGVLALAPNGAAPPTTWGRTVEGPLVWLGEGTYAEMAGKPVDGCIAAVRFGTANIPRILAQGAQAVVAVEDPATDQWDAARMFHGAPVGSPRVWVPAAAAAAAGITTADGKARASLRVRQSWQEARAANLWCLLPATPGGDPEQAKQTMVLAAGVSTFGAVPELSPDGRQAANAALLAEMAVRLAAQPRGRNLLVVFLGGTQHAQEGARVLYYIMRKVNAGSSDGDPLGPREAALTEQAQVAARRAGMLASADVLQAGGDDGFALGLELRRVLTAQVNDLNYRYRMLNLARAAAEEKAKGKDGAGSAAEAARLGGEAAEMKQHIARLNELRRQLHEKRITDAETFAELRGGLSGDFRAQAAWLTQSAADTASYRRLERHLAAAPITAHIGLDLAAADRPMIFNPFGMRLWIAISDYDRMQIGPFAKHLTAYQRVFAAARPADGAGWPAPLYVSDQAANYSFDSLCTPRPRSVPCIVPLAQGIMGSQLTTLGDRLPYDHVPHSPAPDLLPVAGQLTAYATALGRADLPVKTGLRQSTYYDDKLVFRWNGERWGGLKIDRLALGSEEVAGPAAGAVFNVNGSTGLAAVGDVTLSGSEGAMAVVGPTGHVFVPGLLDNAEPRRSAMSLGPDGAIAGYYDGHVGTGTAFNIRLFSGFGGALYTEFNPADYGVTLPFKRLVARTDSVVKRAFGGAGRLGTMLVTNEERNIKLVGNGLLLLNATPDRPQGHGYPVDAAGQLRLDAVRRSGADITVLNHKRLSVLREKNLINRPVERLHADCGDHLDAARAARQADDIPLATAHETMAAVLSWRAYVPLTATSNELLRAVVILLILSIPFAFALERLVLGAVSIYRQIGGFIGIFAATFIVLYFTHPAFSLASAPVIIFLAFVIILLSAFVISVVMGKFKHELKALQGLSAKSHSTGAEASTTMAAVIIGMAGMRNRPLKTFLTIATVTLLTFTILVFASFESGLGVVQTWLGRARGEDRIEVHQPTFLRIPDRLAESVERLYGDRFEVVRRTAVFRDPRAPAGIADATQAILAPASGKAQRLDAILGLDPAESKRLRDLFPGLARGPVGGAQPIYLSATTAGQLQARVGDEVRLRGVPFRVAGTFAEDAVRGLERIDGSRLTPPDFDATLAAASQGQQALPSGTQFDMAFSAIDITAFVYSSPALVAVTTNAGTAALDGFVNGLVLYPRGLETDVPAAAEELATRFNGPVYATTGDGSKRFFFTQAMQGSGYSDLIVPLLLGGLIIFSSLLGSIVDRQKEIFTYSALGLSPRDVGMLFFAESAVVAVVGGLGGYLIGQLVAKVLNVMGNHGLIEVPDFNFSSLSALVTILIVMAMVMLSTIYPALMASKSANPGVNRAWKMPKPDGNRLSFTFPFTVPEKSFGGIAAFIREHFQNHGDAALDVFAAKQVALARGEGGRLAISAEIALAPFDLGVYQRFRMTTRASDIAGIDEVVVDIERVNGTPATWLRGNRGFVADLREQFLIWRSLPVETTEHYQALAAEVVQAAGQQQDGDHV